MVSLRPAVVCVAAIAVIALSCGEDEAPETEGLIPDSALVGLALTETEGQSVLPGFTIYPFSPPVGLVPNEEFCDRESWGSAAVRKSLVETFHRSTGYHGEYFSDVVPPLAMQVEMELFASVGDADGAFDAILESFRQDQPQGLALSKSKVEPVGLEGFSVTFAATGFSSHVVVFRRANLVVGVGVRIDDPNALGIARAMAAILDAKASAVKLAE